MVSGVYFYKDTDQIMDYGPAWDFVDFSMFMTFQTGTSFSAPFLNAMAGFCAADTEEQLRRRKSIDILLIIVFIWERRGRIPNMGMAYRFLGIRERNISGEVKK